jgi:hypothetical protein
MKTKLFILALIPIFALFSACSENEIEKEAIISSALTISVKGVPSTSSVTFESHLSSNNVFVERYGHCIYSSENMTEISDALYYSVANGNIASAFESTIEDYNYEFLEEGKIYYARAFVQNLNGIVFSNPISFVCMASMDPSEYSGIASSSMQSIFQEDFNDNNNGWPIDGDDDISYSIYGGYYTISHTADGYFYSPLITLSSFDNSNDYQVEAYMKISDDYYYDYSGCGILWATNSISSFYSFVTYSNSYEYYIGHREYDSWMDRIQESTYADEINGEGYYNKLTLRKYDGRYYFFINETLVYDCDYLSTYGNDFGFYLLKSEIEIDWFNVSYINSTSKSNVEVIGKGYSFRGKVNNE